jgi:ATP-dependent exoDNAse (exonuclease V) beta subunit
VALYERLAPEADRLGAAGTLEALVEATRLREKLAGTFRGRQKIGNLEKLIELGRAYSRETWSNLPGFARRLQVLIEREPRESEGQVVEERSDAVRIMTIHQSKGLEFPVVAVPELHTLAARAASGAPILYDRQFGVQARLRVRMRGNPKPLELCTESYDNLRKTAKEREEAEERRLIYVAVTRAKDRLWISGRGYAREHHGGRTQLSRPNPLSKLQDLLHEQDKALVALCRERFLDELAPLVGPRGRDEGDDDGLDVESWEAALGRISQGEEDDGGQVEVSATVSQLADFMRCPRRHWLWHELGLEESGEGEELEREAGEELPLQGWGLSLGIVAHGVLESLDLVAYEAAALEGRAELLQDALRSCGLPLAWEEEVRGALEGALGGVLLPWLAQVQRAGRLWRERPFWLRLEGEREVLHLRGRLDAMWLDGDGVGVLDWKFGRRGVLGASAHQWEVAMYALAARTLMEDERPRWRAKVFFLKDAVCEEVEGSEEVLEGLRRVLPLLGRRLALARRRGQWPKVDSAGQPRTREACEAEGCVFVRRCFGGSPA